MKLSLTTDEAALVNIVKKAVEYHSIGIPIKDAIEKEEIVASMRLLLKVLDMVNQYTETTGYTYCSNIILMSDDQELYIIERVSSYEPTPMDKVILYDGRVVTVNSANYFEVCENGKTRQKFSICEPISDNDPMPLYFFDECIPLKRICTKPLKV